MCAEKNADRIERTTKCELERMERLGATEKVEHPSTWCSGMVVATKFNSK